MQGADADCFTPRSNAGHHQRTIVGHVHWPPAKLLLTLRHSTSRPMSSLLLPLAFIFIVFAHAESTPAHVNSSLPLFGDFKVVLDVPISSTRVPEYSVVISVHNGARYVAAHLEQLLRLTTSSWELIMVFDSCTDASLALALGTVADRLIPTAGSCVSDLTRVSFLESATPAFETSSDNAGMRHAHKSSKFFILVQADVMVTELGWNEWIALPFRLYDDLLAVSAMCTHNLVIGAPSSGVCDPTPDHSTHFTDYGGVNASRANIHVRDTVNRGPLALRADRVLKLNYFDERNFLLGDDDHNLMMRGLGNYGWASAKYFMGFLHNRGSDGISRPTILDRPQASLQGAVKDLRKALRNGTEHEALRAQLAANYTARWGTRAITYEQRRATEVNLRRLCAACKLMNSTVGDRANRVICPSS